MSNAAVGSVPAQWMCLPCGYIYDAAEGEPEHGIPPGTPFEQVGPDYVCPLCGVGREEFQQV